MFRVWFQVSNGPINSNSSISSSQTAQSGLVKSIPAKVPSTSTCTSPGKQTQPQQSTSPVIFNFNSFHLKRIDFKFYFFRFFLVQKSRQSPSQTQTSLANGFTTTTLPPTSSTTHSTPSITTPISNQSAITNGTPHSLGSAVQPPSTLQVKPTEKKMFQFSEFIFTRKMIYFLQAVAPSVHPPLDNSTAASGRTNSPAVATSAVLSAAAPAANATTVSSNGKCF